MTSFFSAIVMQCYVDETMDKKNINYQQNVLLVANFEEFFCGVIVELLTK